MQKAKTIGKVLIASGITFAALCSTANAQWYVGGGVGSSKSSGIDGTTRVGALNLTSTGDSSRTSWKLLGGYQFTQNWGVEGQYADLGNRSVNVTTGAVSGNGNASANQWSIAGTGTLPLGSGFAFIAKLGVTGNKINGGNFCAGATCAPIGSNNKTDLLAGVGVNYSISKNIGVRAEYENFGKFSSNGGANNGAIKADNWSLNLLYSF